MARNRPAESGVVVVVVMVYNCNSQGNWLVYAFQTVEGNWHFMLEKNTTMKIKEWKSCLELFIYFMLMDFSFQQF